MKIIRLEKWISLFLIMISGVFRIKYDTSNSLKKDKEKIFKDSINSEKIRKNIEKLSITFPNTLNIKRLQPKSEHKFRLRI